MAIKKLASGLYQIDFRDRAGARHRESFALKKDAQSALDKKRTEVRKGEYVAPKALPTFKEMAELWFENKKVNAGKNGRPVKETTLDHWKNHIDSYLTPAFGDYRLDEISTPAIEKTRLLWRDRDKLAPVTVNKLLTTTTAILNEAVRLGKIKENVAGIAQWLGVGSVEASDRESGNVGPQEVYHPEELKRLIQNAKPGFFKTLIFTVAMTGIRHGEALGLQWGDLDLGVGKMTVRRTWPDKWRDNEPIFYVPKSKHGVREIPSRPSWYKH